MTTTVSPTRLILMGAATTLAGIGLGRFAYAAQLPGLIEAGWLSARDAGFVGATNLLGYLVGAVLASRLARRLGPGPVIKLSTLLIAVSFLASMWQGQVWWFSLWRFVAGVTGALLMVVAPSLIASQLPESKRKRGTAWIFTGVGTGVLISATLVPLLMQQGPELTWLGLGLIALLPVALVWRPWPGLPQAPQQGQQRARVGLVLAAIYLAYLLDAVGFVPHTVFWVDYLERQRDFSTWAAAIQWGLVALGAISGPFLVGAVARHAGWHRTLFTALALKGTAVLLPMLVPGTLVVSLSSFTVGALIPGMVATTMGRIGELVPAHVHATAWGRATALFAVGQAAAAYLMAPIYASAEHSSLIFIIGGSALLCAATLTLAMPLFAKHKPVTEVS